MRTSKLEIPQDKIKDFCRQRRVKEMAFFGSVLRDDFGPASDIDVLVSFAPETHYSLFDLADMREELRAILGREADLVEKEALRNPFRRNHIHKNKESLKTLSKHTQKFRGNKSSVSAMCLRTNKEKFTLIFSVPSKSNSEFRA